MLKVLLGGDRTFRAKSGGNRLESRFQQGSAPFPPFARGSRSLDPIKALKVPGQGGEAAAAWMVGQGALPAAVPQ